MPPTLTYPGVYIEELPSGVHTITGVATSIAAFIGWANQGPTDEAVLVESFPDFERQFGGLTNSTGSPDLLGYAVSHFFANGGQQAYIIRLAGTDAATASAAGVGGTLDVWAKNPGDWGNKLVVRIIVPTSGSSRFTLQVLDSVSGQVLENFPNLSAATPDLQQRYVVTVINNDSQLITFTDPTNNQTSTPSGPPADNSGPSSPPGTVAGEQLTGGHDGTTLVPGTSGFHNALIPVSPSPNPNQSGLHLLDRVDIFNLLCVPGENDSATIQLLQGYCTSNRAFYIVDCPQDVDHDVLNSEGPVGEDRQSGQLTGVNSNNSAYYFPWVNAPDPLAGGRATLFPPCGFVAGIYARVDGARGVWKAPAGIEASLVGVSGLELDLTDEENGDLNTQAINCLRHFKIYGDVVWGARTLQGNDHAGSQWKYVPIRRLALFLESSLYDGTQWVVFEPNDEPLWSQIRLNVGAFMQGLFLQGAFQGTTPKQAYFVKCDAENNPQSSIDQGIVNILVGFAPLYPAEFVVIQIQQLAGQLQA
jgi:phage tail sheath protein FI